MSKLLYVGQQIADELSINIAINIDRYQDGDFLDLESAGDWRIPLSISADLDELYMLRPEGRPEDEINNSILVARALRELTPSLARENRIWVRLSHIECLDYSRKRWLSSKANDEKILADIRKHFFAPTLPGCRDDHSISRLWWNHRIAKQIMPEEPVRALKIILARADLRLTLIERPGIGARPNLARGIIRTLESNIALLKGEDFFRRFMKKVNLLGAGIAFEALSDQAIDQFLKDCLGQIDASQQPSSAAAI